MGQTQLKGQSLADFINWDIYDKLPKSGSVDIYPFSNPYRIDRAYSAWHIPSVGVFPHTRRYRLLKSILENDLEELKLVIDEKVDVNDQIDFKYGYTPLTLASALNRTAIINYLFIRGADLNQLDKQGISPLMAAIKNWQYESIILLEKLGSDIFQKDQFGFTSLQKAQMKNMKPIEIFLETKIKEKNSQNPQKQPNSYPKFPTLEITTNLEKIFSDTATTIFFSLDKYNSQPLRNPFTRFKNQYNVDLIHEK